MKALPSLFAVSLLVFTVSSRAWAQDDGGSVTFSNGYNSGELSMNAGVMNINSNYTDVDWDGGVTIANAFSSSSVVLFSAETDNIVGAISLQDANNTLSATNIAALQLLGGGNLTLANTNIYNPFILDTTTVDSGALTVLNNTYSGGTLVFNGTGNLILANLGTINSGAQITLTSGTSGAITSNALVVPDGGQPTGTLGTNSLPEPTATVLLAGGLALLARRRQRRAA